MSVANKDEAFKCLSIAKRHLGKGDGERARHFGEKAKTLFPCPEVLHPFFLVKTGLILMFVTG